MLSPKRENSLPKHPHYQFFWNYSVNDMVRNPWASAFTRE